MNTSSSRPQRAPRSGIVTPTILRRPQRWMATLAYTLLRTVAATLRYEWHYPAAVLNRERGPAIFCVWHNRLALALTFYRDYVRRRRQPFRLAAMVSASKDGAVVARILDHFGVQPVRGSSSRRGPQALLEMTSWAERGYDLSVTPDGPRGPRYRVQEGVIHMAQLTGLPVIPASCRIHWKRCVRSWDGFQIPLPLSRVVVRVGEPLRVPQNVSEAEREILRQELENTLKELGGD